MRLLNDTHKKLLMDAIHGNVNSSSSYTTYKYLASQPEILNVPGKRNQLDLEMFVFAFTEIKTLTVPQLDKCNALLLLDLAHITLKKNIHKKAVEQFIIFLMIRGKNGSLPCLKLYFSIKKPSSIEIDKVLFNTHLLTLQILLKHMPRYALEFEAHKDELELFEGKTTLYDRVLQLYYRALESYIAEQNPIDLAGHDFSLTGPQSEPESNLMAGARSQSFRQRIERELGTDNETLEKQAHLIQQMKEIKALLLFYKSAPTPHEHKKMISFFEAAVEYNPRKAERNDFTAERHLGCSLLKASQAAINDTDAQSAQKKDRFDAALSYLRQACLAGDPYAKFFFGKCQLHGFLSVTQDTTSGLSLIRESAAWGLLPAQKKLADYYFSIHHYQEAAIWYQLELDQGCVEDIAERLAICLQKTSGTAVKNKTRVAHGLVEIRGIFPPTFNWASLAQEDGASFHEVPIHENDSLYTMPENDEPPAKKQKTAHAAYSPHTALFKPPANIQPNKAQSIDLTPTAAGINMSMSRK